MCWALPLATGAIVWFATQALNTDARQSASGVGEGDVTAGAERRPDIRSFSARPI
jgi:hypothetical protein